MPITQHPYDPIAVTIQLLIAQLEHLPKFECAAPLLELRRR